jgi:hypothetical protein
MLKYGVKSAADDFALRMNGTSLVVYLADLVIMINNGFHGPKIGDTINYGKVLNQDRTSYAGLRMEFMISWEMLKNGLYRVKVAIGHIL